ncbi:MAG: MBL fold metallo-hydrolase [Gemmatimonadota bacterium]
MNLWTILRESIGYRATQVARSRFASSPQWREGRFRPALRRVDGSLLTAAWRYFFAGPPHRVPDSPLPVVPVRPERFASPPQGGLRATWLGHSTVLLEIDGKRILIDPVWTERASGFPGIGPRRFFPPLLALDQLPDLDLVVISHDHYDHLDVAAVRILAARGLRMLAPLGVGSHLRRWGVPDAQISEVDWWHGFSLGDLTVTATPGRHFSGRGLLDHGQTLWAGFAFNGPRHRVYLSGDSAMHEDFSEIGERLGPFDLTMIEVGAYDAIWADVHLGPEQAVLAHQQVRGRVMLPLHWGMFDLALHGWTEPIERTLVAAANAGIRVTTPRPGESVEPALEPPSTRWWPALPWRTAEDAPVRSSGLAQVESTTAATRPPQPHPE